MHEQDETRKMVDVMLVVHSSYDAVLIQRGRPARYAQLLHESIRVREKTMQTPASAAPQHTYRCPYECTRRCPSHLLV